MDDLHCPCFEVVGTFYKFATEWNTKMMACRLHNREGVHLEQRQVNLGECVREKKYTTGMTLANLNSEE